MNLDRPTFLRLAVPTPLPRLFDYLPPAGCECDALRPGIRVRVPFGRLHHVAILIEVVHQSDVPPERLRHADAVLDDEPIWSPDELQLLQWASAYYHHPLGEVLNTALPKALRQGRAARPERERIWCLTESGRAITPDSLKRAPRQAQLLQALNETSAGLGSDSLSSVVEKWQQPMKALVEKGWVEVAERDLVVTPAVIESGPPLNPAQAAAVQSICEGLDRFEAYLVDGVTGSGKTEVYLGVVNAVVAQGRQALILVPEIGLTPQLVSRFRSRVAAPVVVLHSGLSDGERYRNWLLARSGQAAVVLGTRSAVFTPLKHPGVILVDEEHDASFKQQDRFRYSARDLAVMRARRHQIPVVLGSATPSLESLHNVGAKRYQRLHLPERAGNAVQPPIAVLDMRKQPVQGGISAALAEKVSAHLDAGGQVMLFLNRRGYAPALICHSCGWMAECRRCDAKMTLHQGRGRLICHHCGSEWPSLSHCRECGDGEMHPVGYGTERLGEALQARFPQVPVLRVDRDSTRRKGSLEAILDQIHTGQPAILVGTQMLAKGHDFPGVTLVGIVDADQGLFSTDFRASERMAQLIVQVAGRAGRAERPGEVWIQTHIPDHPLLETLIRHGYSAFAEAALAEREQSQFPPFGRLALLRAEAVEPAVAMGFLTDARDLAQQTGADNGVMVLGPVAAPMARRAGRYRAQLLLQCSERAGLQRLLSHWLPQVAALPSAKRARWSVDIDPQEMY